MAIKAEGRALVRHRLRNLAIGAAVAGSSVAGVVAFSTQAHAANKCSTGEPASSVKPNQSLGGLGSIPSIHCHFGGGTGGSLGGVFSGGGGGGFTINPLGALSGIKIPTSGLP